MGTQRFVSASEKAAILAEGVYLYAKFMDTTSRNSPEWQAYEAWQEKNYDNGFAHKAMEVHRTNMDWAINHQGPM